MRCGRGRCLAALAIFTGTVTAGQTVSHTLSSFTPALFADSTDLGPDWVEEEGEWNIADEQLHCSVGQDGCRMATTESCDDTAFGHQGLLIFDFHTLFWRSGVIVGVAGNEEFGQAAPHRLLTRQVLGLFDIQLLQ